MQVRFAKRIFDDCCFPCPRFLFVILYLLTVCCLFILVIALNDRLLKRFSELSRLATNIECVDQLMDLLRMQNSMDEILTLISQTASQQVHARIAELLHTLLNVSDVVCFFSFVKSKSLLPMLLN